MRILVACKRGNIAERDRFGHCLCIDCKKFRKERSKVTVDQNKRKEWEKANKEKILGYSKKWNESNKQKRRDIEIAWKLKNPEKVAAYSAKAGRKWSQNNKGKRLASVRKRQLAKILRTPKWADLNAISLFYIKAQLLSKESGTKYEVDHILPLQGDFVSGLHVHQNLQILTRTKNRSKGNNTCVF